MRRLRACSIAAVLAVVHSFVWTAAATDTAIPERFAGAPAVVLLDERFWEVAPLREADYHVKRRILVLDAGGFDQADQGILYDEDSSRIDSFFARTVLPGGKVVPVTESLVADVVVAKSENAEWRRRQFTFPAVQPGAVLELEYRIHEGRPGFSKSWEPQRDIPVLETRYKIRLKQLTGYERLGILSFPRASHGDRCEIEEETDKARASTLVLACRNLPGFAPEPQAPPERDARLAWEFMYGNEEMIRSIWTSIGESWRERIDRYIGGRKKIPALVKTLVEKQMSEAEKVDAIYDWVKRNLTVREAYMPGSEMRDSGWQEGVDAALESGGGLPAEVAMVTLALLQDAGLRARALVAADRGEGLFDYNAIDAPALEHVMLRVKIDGIDNVLDPSCGACTPGVTDWRYASSRPSGIQLDPVPGAPIIVRVPPARHNSELRREYVTLRTDGSARVEGEVRWRGQVAIDLRRSWADLPDHARREEFLGDLVGQIDEATVTFSDPNDVFEDLTAEYSYVTTLPVTSDRRLLIRPPGTFADLLEIPIQEERSQSLWYPFPLALQTRVTFKLPAGYDAELPDEPVQVDGPDVVFKGTWKHGPQAGEIVWVGQLALHEPEIDVEQYPEAREFARGMAAALRRGLVADVEAP